MNFYVRPYHFQTTYGPKVVDVHTFSKKLKDVTEKTNIRQFQGSPIKLEVVVYMCNDNVRESITFACPPISIENEVRIKKK